MASNVPNRKTARKDLAAILVTACIGTGKITKKVYAYKPRAFPDGSPVVCVTSASSERIKHSQPVTAVSVFLLDIHTFVVYYSAKSTTPWTEENSEDAIDDIEKLISDTIIDNETIINKWAFLERDGETTMENVIISGVEYQHEIIPVKIRAWSD